MRPKLKNDTFYMPIEDGVYLHNNQGWVKLPGKGTYTWIERLSPFLTGDFTLEELIRDLPADKQIIVKNIIQFLSMKGFIKDCSEDAVSSLSAEEKRVYAPEIAFIDAFNNSAEYRFERFRETPALLIGSGTAFTALVQAVLRMGMREVHALPTREAPLTYQLDQDDLKLLRQRDPHLTLTITEPPDWSDSAAITRLFDRYGAIIHISDQPMLARARLLNQHALASQKLFIQAVVIDDQAWIGPLVLDRAQGCWECAWQRLQANIALPQRNLYSWIDQPDRVASRYLAGPTVGVIANVLAFEIFKQLTETGHVETQGQMIRIDLETLDSRRHRFLPHPLCEACQHPKAPLMTALLDTVHLLEQNGTIDEEQFSKQIVPCFDQALGLFRELGEHDLIQMPLNVSQVIVSNPLHLVEEQALTVHAVGADLATARRRAARRACEIYAASVVDRRRLMAAELVLGRRDVAYAAPAALDDDSEFTWAYTLHSGSMQRVMTSIMFPSLHQQAPSAATAPGLASGFSWAEAVGRALLAHCERLTIAQIGGARQPFPRVALDDLALTDEGRAYRRMLEAINAPVALYDVTGALGVPTFAGCLGDRTIAYAAHFNVAEALQIVLERLLQHDQAIHTGQPAYAPPAAPNLSQMLRGDAWKAPAYKTSDSWTERMHDLVQALYDSGWEALAVPLDHDAALNRVLPVIVNVVLLPRNGASYA